MNLSALCVEYISVSLSCNHDFIDLLQNSLPLSTHAYLLKISITHNKKRTLLLILLFDCISARSALQILSVKGECTFGLSNFLIIGLCNTSANSWFRKISHLTAPLQNLFYVAKVSDLARVTDDFLLKIF